MNEPPVEPPPIVDEGVQPPAAPPIAPPPIPPSLDAPPALSESPESHAPPPAKRNVKTLVSGFDWRRWIVPLIALLAVIVIGLVIRHKIRNEVWAYYTDGEDIKVAVDEKKERMVLWEDPQQHVFGSKQDSDQSRARGKSQSQPIDLAGQRVEAAFSPDGATMVLTHQTSRGDSDVFLSSWNGRAWSQPRPLVDLNTSSNECGAAFSRDGAYLYFSSDRRGGFGGFDLYVARFNGRRWTAVKSLGPSINSRGNESDPASSANGDRLFFSSDRDTGNGTQDIYVAKFQGMMQGRLPRYGQAELVSNLNSRDDDIDAAVTGPGDYVFLASDRDRSGDSGFNLYISRVIDGEVQRPELVDVYIRTGNATDPAVRMQGFDLLFSADGDLTTNKTSNADNAPDPAYRLYRSTTREVIGYTDLSRWELFKELMQKIQWLLLLALASLIALIYLLEKWRDITSLFHKCLAASAGAHLILLMFMMFWLISQAIEEEEEPTADVAISVDALAQEEMAMESEQELAEVMDTTQMAVTKSVQELPETSFEPQQIVENSIAETQQTFENESLVSEVKQAQASDSAESEPIPEPMQQSAKLAELNPIELPVSAVEAMEMAELPTQENTTPVDPTKDDFQTDEVAIQQIQSQKIDVAQAMSQQIDAQADTASVATSDAMSESSESQPDLVQPTEGLEAMEEMAPDIAGGIAPLELAVVAIDSMETAEVPSESSAEPVDSSQDDFQPDAVAIQQVNSQKADVGQAASSQMDVQADSQSVAQSTQSEGMAQDSQSQSDLVQPATGLEAMNPSVEIGGSIAPVELSVVAVEAMGSAEMPSDDVANPVDTTRDDFQPDGMAVQQVESQKANVGPIGSSQLEVQAEAESVASSNQATQAMEADGGLIQPTSGFEAVEPATDLVGSIAPIELSVTAAEAMETAEVRSDSTAQPVDTSQDDFQADGVAVQQVETQKADIAQATGSNMDVESESVARSDEVANTFDPQGDTIQANKGLEATADGSGLPASESLADLAASLPGSGALEIPAGEAMEAPKDVDIAAIGKYLKQQRGNLSESMIEQLGGSTGTERAIGLGLDWFTDNQEPDGRWEMAKHQGKSQDNIAGAGFALLCYYGWGIKHGRYAGDTEHERHSKAVTKALDWLLKQQGDDGSLLGSETNHAMYCHGIAAVALCEGYGLTKDPDLKGPATKAIDYILKAQHEAGGWRYSPGEPGDLSVTGWQYMALHSARMAGIEVPDAAFTKTERFLDRVSGGANGGYYGYMTPEKNKPTMTATGMFLRQLDGVAPTEPSQQESAQVLKSKMLRSGSVDFYYDYYATLALYQHQGPIWEEWNENLKEVYLTLQTTTGPGKGSWDTKGGFVKTGGRVVSTGLAILNLEVYYRLLPMYGYQRDEE